MCRYLIVWTQAPINSPFSFNLTAEIHYPTPPHNSAAQLRCTTPPHNSAAQFRRTTPPRNSTAQLRRTTPPRNPTAQSRRTTPPHNPTIQSIAPGYLRAVHSDAEYRSSYSVSLRHLSSSTLLFNSGLKMPKHHTSCPRLHCAPINLSSPSPDNRTVPQEKCPPLVGPGFDLTTSPAHVPNSLPGACSDLVKHLLEFPLLPYIISFSSLFRHRTVNNVVPFSYTNIFDYISTLHPHTLGIERSTSPPSFSAHVHVALSNATPCYNFRDPLSSASDIDACASKRVFRPRLKRCSGERTDLMVPRRAG